MQTQADMQKPRFIPNIRAFSMDEQANQRNVLKAIALGDWKGIAMHARLGHDMNTLDDGYTPLYEAVIRGKAEAVAMLLMHGATIDAPSKGGHTALLTAARMAKDVNDDRIVRLLLARGARDDLADRTGETAADVLTKRGHARYVGKRTATATSQKLKVLCEKHVGPF